MEWLTNRMTRTTPEQIKPMQMAVNRMFVSLYLHFDFGALVEQSVLILLFGRVWWNFEACGGVALEKGFREVLFSFAVDRAMGSIGFSREKCDGGWEFRLRRAGRDGIWRGWEIWVTGPAWLVAWEVKLCMLDKDCCTRCTFFSSEYGSGFAAFS